MISIGFIAEKFKRLSDALIFCHVRPDGDTIGSAIALKFAFDLLNIPSEIVCADKIPSKFFFIKGASEIACKPSRTYSCHIALDCASAGRIGELFALYSDKNAVKFNIDHHESNERYAENSFIEDKSATAMIVYGIIKQMGLSLNYDIATALYLGICTDTGGFAHRNVNSETFTVAADLVSYGVDNNAIYYEMFEKQTQSRAKLFASVTSKMRLLLDGKLGLIYVTKEDIIKANSNDDETEGFVNFPLSIDGVEVSACLLEMKKYHYKISLRAKTASVGDVAASYGGGGHKLAAGCLICGELEEVIDKLTYTVSQYL